jgi:two-component system phosphate regulon sensor histidine kinase PhoR
LVRALYRPRSADLDEVAFTHADAPLLDVRLLENPVFLAANIVGYVGVVGLFAAQFLLPLFLETIQGAAKNDPKAQEKFLGLMKSQAERIRRLIDDLLSLSRIEMNEHVRPSGEVDLTQVSAHVRDVLSGMAKDFDCELRLESDGPLTIAGSRDELVQVIQNLAENALKYGSSGKLVEIVVRKDEEWAEVSVRDHGPGIAEQHIPRLTERFYRVNVQDSRSRGGTGLGLAIVKHIVNRHRGRLVITSEIGKGSTFMMRLPLNAS